MSTMNWGHEQVADAFRTFKARMEFYLEDQNVNDRHTKTIKIALGGEGMRIIHQVCPTMTRKIQMQSGSSLRNRLTCQEQVSRPSSGVFTYASEIRRKYNRLCIKTP